MQSADHETVASAISFEGQASPIWRTEMILQGKNPRSFKSSREERTYEGLNIQK